VVAKALPLELLLDRRPQEVGRLLCGHVIDVQARPGTGHSRVGKPAALATGDHVLGDALQVMDAEELQPVPERPGVRLRDVVKQRS
jgi:hypothetical protein